MSTAGQKKFRVDIQANTKQASSTGQMVETWATVATVWASITPLTGREYYWAQQVYSNVTHKIEMYFYSGLTTKHRIKYGSRIFNLLEVINVDEQGIEHKLLGVEIV